MAENENIINEAMPVEEKAVEETPVMEAPAKKAPKAPKQKPVPAEDFDWTSSHKKFDNYSADERAKLEEKYAGTMNQIADHEVIEGTVVAITDREVVVNIGFKSDGVIPVAEFRTNPNLKVGDKVEVYVENQEGPNGQLILSHKKAQLLKSWDRVNEAYESGEIVNGYVKSRTKGGLIVEVFGLEAFLPGSQIDVKPIRDYDVFVDSVMEFKVVNSYGVFIDLGGVDGLIHITDLSWGRITHPEEVVKLDEKIKVVILDFDDNKKRIALGLKQLTPHPWDALDPNLKVGDTVKGKVVVIADYGAFVEIAPGVEGLIHVSEMSWSQHLRSAQDFLKVGDEVEAKVLTLDREERKMSLGMKQLMPDPWANITDRYPIGSKHTATVRNFTNFGIFVELEEGVDGLIHISDLSWSKKIKHPAEFTKVGETIDVVVLDVDQENRRLSLGHKQLEENPWDVFETVFTVGSMHQGTVISANDKGAVVSLPYGVEGFCPSRYMKKEDGTNAKVDDTLEFKVLEFNKESKKIILALPKVEEEKEVKSAEEKAADKAAKQAKRTVKQINDNIEHSTLGDLEVLAGLKENLEKQEKAQQGE